MSEEQDRADLEECRTLMRKLAAERTEVTQDSLNEWKAGNAKVFAELLALNGYAGFTIKRHKDQEDRTLDVSLNGATGWILFHHEGRYNVHGLTDVKVPLLWNVVTKEFEGTELDTFRTPIAGAVPAKKSPATMLLEALLAQFPKPRAF